MGLTETGYVRATYNDIVNSKILKAKELFGEDVDTGELTALGKLIRIDAYDLAKAEETAELIYYSRFPNTANGVSLDRLCVFVGITRNPAIPARYTVKVTGTVGYTVPIGFVVGTESGIKFYNVNDTVIGEDGTCEITVTCDTAGITGNIDHEEINEIVNPNVDVQSVQGTALLISGEEAESDYSLRQRFIAAREGQGSCNTNSIRAALIRVETVTGASVMENDTDSTDENGRPPHSFECYISGGENYHKEIAETIFEKKPIGIKTCGTESYILVDDSGQEHVIYFSHTAVINVEISIKIKVSTSYSGDTGEQEIKNNLTSHINGLGVGKPVILSALYGLIHSVAGVTEVTELLLSSDGETFTTNNILVDNYEVARCSVINIEVVA